MALVNLTEAAKLAGISRVTLYKKYIKPGILSVVSDDRNRPAVDTSELLRVFGKLYTDKQSDSVNNLQELTQNLTPETAYLTAQIDALKIIIEHQEQELRAAREEISWLRQRVEAAEQKQLAAPNTNKKKWWWPF
jgi:hypothetical protein